MNSTTAPPWGQHTRHWRWNQGYTTLTQHLQSYLMVGVGAGIQTTHLSKYNNKLYQAQTTRTKTSLLLSEIGVSIVFMVSLHITIKTKPTHILCIPNKCLSSELQTCTELKLKKTPKNTNVQYFSGLHSVYCQSLWKIREGKHISMSCVKSCESYGM